jgi:hypothetical protein
VESELRLPGLIGLSGQNTEIPWVANLEERIA